MSPVTGTFNNRTPHNGTNSNNHSNLGSPNQGSNGMNKITHAQSARNVANEAPTISQHTTSISTADDSEVTPEKLQEMFNQFQHSFATMMAQANDAYGSKHDISRPSKGATHSYGTRSIDFSSNYFTNNGMNNNAFHAHMHTNGYNNFSSYNNHYNQMNNNNNTNNNSHYHNLQMSTGKVPTSIVVSSVDDGGMSNEQKQQQQQSVHRGDSSVLVHHRVGSTSSSLSSGSNRHSHQRSHTTSVAELMIQQQTVSTSNIEMYPSFLNYRSKQRSTDSDTLIINKAILNGDNKNNDDNNNNDSNHKMTPSMDQKEKQKAVDAKLDQLLNSQKQKDSNDNANTNSGSNSNNTNNNNNSNNNNNLGSETNNSTSTTTASGSQSRTGSPRRRIRSKKHQRARSMIPSLYANDGGSLPIVSLERNDSNASQASNASTKSDVALIGGGGGRRHRQQPSMPNFLAKLKTDPNLRSIITSKFAGAKVNPNTATGLGAMNTNKNRISGINPSNKVNFYPNTASAMAAVASGNYNRNTNQNSNIQQKHVTIQDQSIPSSVRGFFVFCLIFVCVVTWCFNCYCAYCIF